MITPNRFDVCGVPGKGTLRSENVSSTCLRFASSSLLAIGLIPTPAAVTMTETTPIIVRVERENSQSAAVQECLAAINSFCEPYTMSDEDVAYFRRKREAAFVPLKPDQIRQLPVRKT